MSRHENTANNENFSEAYITVPTARVHRAVSGLICEEKRAEDDWTSHGVGTVSGLQRMLLTDLCITCLVLCTLESFPHTVIPAL